MDWLIEGFDLQSGTPNLARLPTGAELEAAKASAGRLEEQFGLAFIDHATLARFKKEAEEGTRSLYLLDVRSRGNTRPAIIRALAQRPAGNSCSRPANGSRPRTAASC